MSRRTLNAGSKLDRLYSRISSADHKADSSTAAVSPAPE
jgi:hypothetical protein